MRDSRQIMAEAIAVLAAAKRASYAARTLSRWGVRAPFPHCACNILYHNWNADSGCFGECLIHQKVRGTKIVHRGGSRLCTEAVESQISHDAQST